MRPAPRLFEIVQMLRLARGPVTAAAMAEALEVAPRTVYRDIVALQAMRVPIEGGRGIGYILRPGFNLPPLMFSIEETEALVVALAMLDRTGDVALRDAARKAGRKIAGAVPEPLRQAFDTQALFAWGTPASAPEGISLGLVRESIREERKLEITYRDAEGRASLRRIRPIALIYYSSTANIVAWCELRRDLRTFRTDRLVSGSALDEHFRGEGDRLRALWVAGWSTPP
jgi:predicted DNA-binding transcriptional regulator YafY